VTGKGERNEFAFLALVHGGAVRQLARRLFDATGCNQDDQLDDREPQIGLSQCRYIEAAAHGFERPDAKRGHDADCFLNFAQATPKGF
jgi:hypothetical protein